jgi:PAS domain S-box-containing protein
MDRRTPNPSAAKKKSMRGYFFQLDLRGKITAALLAATLSMGSIITLAVYLAAHYQITSQNQALLEARAQLEQREIELQITSLLAVAESLASNSVTANALADTRGREIYLAPLLRNQKLAVAGASLSIADYRGRPIVSSVEPAPDCGCEPSFEKMMQTGRPQARLLVEAGREAAILLALPIRYRLTNSVEGGVILNIPLAPLLGSSTPADSRGIKDASGAVLVMQTRSPDVFEIEEPLLLPAPLDELKLTLVLTRDRSEALQMLNLLMGAFVLLGAFVVGGVLLFARVGARCIATPLGEIAAAAEEIAASGRPVARLPERRNDEFGRLSTAFNTMVDRLAESYADLENRVAERTREYEESQHDAEKAGSLLRESLSSIAQGFTIYDENDCLVLCNEAYMSFYETSRDLIVPGNTFEQIVRWGAERGQYAEAIGQVDAWVKQRVTQHQSACGEVIEQQLTDGRWLLIVEHRTPSGYIAGNRIDITELKNTAKALHQRELYLRATLDNLPFLFWLKDAEGRFLAVNKVFSDACGRASPEEVVGLTDFDIWPDELAERYRNDDLDVIASRSEKSVEEPVTGGAEADWIETYKKPVITPDGSVLGTVGFARDVTWRRQAQARIREHAEQLNAIFALSPDGFVSFDGAHCVKYISPAFTRMSGLDESQVLGLDEIKFSERLSDLCEPGARFPGIAALRAAQKQLVGDSAQESASNRRRLIELAGAGKRVLEVGLRLSQSETSAEMVSQILYFRDVTHETEVDNMKSEFLSTAAHELRTPMASIYGFADLLLGQEFSPEEQRDFIGTIFKQSELMVSIINELLDLARIEARRGKDFTIARVELRALLHEVVGGFKPPNGRPAPIEPPTNGPLWVRADSKKLTQALNNVLSNAHKYSPEGSPVKIEFILSPSEGDILPRIGIRVIDHGIGMTPAQLARIFERFYRADTSGKVPGTGLGMSITKEIIELHGGEVELTSRIGAGTSVTLWIPASEEKADA